MAGRGEWRGGGIIVFVVRGVFVVLGFVVAAAGCVPVDGDAAFVGDVPFATVSRSNYCTGAPAGGVMVQSEDGIPAGWKKEWFDGAGFGNHTSFAVALGRRFTGGYGISIIAIRADGEGGIVVLYQTSAPQPGDLVTQALTNPCHIVRAPKITGKATFQNAAEQ